jgi:hypothetical protein
MITWRNETHRIVASIGQVDIGAVFTSSGGKYHRWRCWVSMSINPVDGTAVGEENARHQVEERFAAFLAAAGLQAAERPAT